MEPREIPVFANEAEEAEWWFVHREELAQDFVDAAIAGRLGEGSKARYAKRLAELEHKQTNPTDRLRQAS